MHIISVMTSYRKLITTDSRTYIESNNFISAFARISADLEMLLFEKLFFEKSIKAELIEKWSLYTFIQWNIKLDLIEEKWSQILHDFRKLRNKVIHGRVFLINLVKNQEELEEAKNLLLSVCDFIDQTAIVYRSTPELEKAYGAIKRY